MYSLVHGITSEGNRPLAKLVAPDSLIRYAD
jgi:hypothetical protein